MQERLRLPTMALGAVKASSCIQATGALPGSHGQKYSTLTMMVVTPSGTVLTRATSRLKNLDCRSLPLSLCLVSTWQLEKRSRKKRPSVRTVVEIQTCSTSLAACHASNEVHYYLHMGTLHAVLDCRDCNHPIQDGACSPELPITRM